MEIEDRSLLPAEVDIDAAALAERCPRCGSETVRQILSFADDDLPAEPLFDCRECGFEWGELIRGLME